MTPTPQRPPLLPRQGPRPLALHLTIVLGTLLSSSAGLPLLKSGWLPSKPALRGRVSALVGEIAKVDGPLLAKAVDHEMRRRLADILTGLERYRHHPYRRALADPPVVWREGASRLLDYGGTGRPVLFVPSLVNRAYILDLSARRSLLRWLAKEGVRPLLLDWGRPGALERRFTLTDYIAGRLERGFEVAVTAFGAMPVVGYCMGGLLAAALAFRRPRDVTGLGLLATPWDFHAEDPGLSALTTQVFTPFMPILERWGELPVDVIQALFTQLDPWLAARKFSQFARMDPTSSQAEAFVALEDWLNDGIPLVAAVARDCLFGWYGRNDPARINWLVAGQPVDPAGIRAETLAIIPAKDRIVPPASARALADAIPGARAVLPPLGHIGMVVSGGAEAEVWRPLRDWLRAVQR